MLPAGPGAFRRDRRFERLSPRPAAETTSWPLRSGVLRPKRMRLREIQRSPPMSLATPPGYHSLNETSVLAFLGGPARHPRTARRRRCAKWAVREVGDGNLNLVFLVDGTVGAVCVKQSLPYVRAAGESWPMPLERTYFEQAYSQAGRSACERPGPRNLPLRPDAVRHRHGAAVAAHHHAARADRGAALSRTPRGTSATTSRAPASSPPTSPFRSMRNSPASPISPTIWRCAASPPSWCSRIRIGSWSAIAGPARSSTMSQQACAPTAR